MIILIRSAALFFLTLFVVRIMGKRHISRLTFFDFVAGMVIGLIAAGISLNIVKSLTGGLLALAVWTLFPIALYYLSLKFKMVRDIVQGRETILINHGKVLEDKLMEVRYTPEDLLSQLRKKNVFSFADVEFAVLEPDGEVSVFLNKDKSPVTPKSMGISVGRESVPQTVVLDGEIMDESLTAMGLNRGWLFTELEKAGVSVENVFIGQVDSTGQLYLDLFDDAVPVQKPKTRELAWATLKKCQADCQLYALGTNNPEAKLMYGRSAALLSEVAEELEPLLMR